jgi:ribosomal protein S18 acetylase RimI-like enzyme
MKITQTHDYATIALLNETVQTLHAAQFPSYFKPYEYGPIRDFFKAIITDPKQIFLLVEDDDVPIGYAWMTIKESTDSAFKKASKSIYIHQISINKSNSHNGAGSKLIAYTEQLAKNIGATKIELDYWINNTIARNFYHKLGFVIKREIVQKELN